MWRILKYLTASILIGIIIISVAGIIVARYYQDEIRKLFVDELNKHIQTEIVADDLSFSVLRRFPKASLEFKNVLVKTREGFTGNSNFNIDSDTLLTAERLFLQFSLGDIFRKEYKISTIRAVNGVIYLYVNNEGDENYKFWQSSVSGGEDLYFDLQDVRFNNYRVKYANDIKHLYFESDIDRMNLKGNFSRSYFQLQASVSGETRQYLQNGINFSERTQISAKLTLNIDDDLISIDEGVLEFGDIRLTADGVYERGDPSVVDVNLRGYNLDIASAIPFLSMSLRDGINKWKVSGRFDFDSSISGRLSKTISPSIIASFSTDNSEIIRRDSGIRLQKISLSGYYTNGHLRNSGSSEIVINKFSSGFGKGHISGKGSLSNLNHPDINIEIDGSVFLEEAFQFFQPKNIKHISGHLITSLSADGSVTLPLKLEIEQFDNIKIRGDLAISNGTLEISDGRYIASNINGELDLGEAIKTNGLSFNIDEDHFLIGGEINNGLPWLLGKQETMSITGNLYSRHINLDNYILPASEGDRSADSNTKLLFPSNVILNLDFIADELRFRKFTSEKFIGKLSYKPRMMVLNAVEFNSMDGVFAGNGVIVQRMNGDFMVQSQLQISNADIQKMFYSFNDFGQTFINGNNLKGRLTGNMGLISEWSPELTIIREKIIADSKFEISNGELIGFEPMLGLARFIDVHELQHIRFSTLANEIFIRNGVITIPHMDVNSSAFNISGSGTHRFDGEFEYRMRVLLSDVLYGKARSAKPENTEYGIVEDDGLGRTSLYLLVSGNSHNYRVSYDRMALRDVLKENIASERTALRKMLHEEFGWFSPDTANIGVPGQPGPASPRHRIIWDEEDERPPSEVHQEQEPAGDKKQPAERRFRIIWDEEEKPNDQSL